MAYAAGDVINFAYTGAAQTVKLPPGRYKLEVWGAKGGQRRTSYGSGGLGGYSVGELSLDDETDLIAQVGGAGSRMTSSTAGGGGYNGGGNSKYYGGGGGGATDFRIGQNSLYARVIVAGGGGGAQGRGSANYKASGGAGGGSSGQSGGYFGTNVASSSGGQGGTQTAAGGVVNSSYGNTAGSFGVGGDGSYSSSTYCGVGAGGGGWYGGGTGQYRYSGGGGGSGFVWTGQNAPSGYLLSSKYCLTNASTVAGTASFTDPDGTTVTGHSGAGYARITVLEIYTLAPDPVRDLAASVGNGTVTLSWSASEGASGYRLSRDGVQLSDQTDLTFTDTVAKNQSYVYSVIAYNDEGESNPAELTVFVPLVPPGCPQNFRQTEQTYFTIGLAWDAVSGANGYKLYKDGALLSTQTGTTYTDVGMMPAESHTYTLTAYNDDGDSAAVSLTAATKTAEYYIVTPVIHSASFSVNPADMNTSTVLTVTVTDEFMILEPDFWYSDETYSGEV